MIENALLKIMEAYEEMVDQKIQTPENFFRDITDLPKYDDMLKSGEAHVEMMTPMQYFCLAARVLGVDRRGIPLMDVLNKIEYSRRTVDELKKKKNLDMPMVDLRDRWQEGIRRMAAAKELFGSTTKFPVCVVR